MVKTLSRLSWDAFQFGVIFGEARKHVMGSPFSKDITFCD
jgi:hypothetical protein